MVTASPVIRRPQYPSPILAMTAVGLTGAFWFLTPESQSPIDSGNYRLLQIHEDATVTVVGSDGLRPLRVGWLGVSIEHPQQATQWLRTQLSEREELEVRFDRRRLDSVGHLVAYLFRDGELLNESLIRSGWAAEATHPADYGPFVRRLRRATADDSSR